MCNFIGKFFFSPFILLRSSSSWSLFVQVLDWIVANDDNNNNNNTTILMEKCPSWFVCVSSNSFIYAVLLFSKYSTYSFKYHLFSLTVRLCFSYTVSVFFSPSSCCRFVTDPYHFRAIRSLYKYVFVCFFFLHSFALPRSRKWSDRPRKTHGKRHANRLPADRILIRLLFSHNPNGIWSQKHNCRAHNIYYVSWQQQHSAFLHTIWIALHWIRYDFVGLSFVYGLTILPYINIFFVWFLVFILYSSALDRRRRCCSSCCMHGRETL